MKLNWKAIIGILLAAVVMFIVVNVLYGDSYKLLSGDLLNNQEELTQLAQELLSDNESELFDKYDITYDIEAKDGAVFFHVPSSSVGMYYVSDDVALSMGADREICDNWYFYDTEA